MVQYGQERFWATSWTRRKWSPWWCRTQDLKILTCELQEVWYQSVPDMETLVWQLSLSPRPNVIAVSLPVRATGQKL